MSARIVLVVALAVVVAGCATAPNALSVIRIDGEHLMTRRSDNTEAPAYAIESRQGFILDASGYKFQASSDSDRATPTMIQLIVDQRGLYETPWQAGVEQYSLTAITLVPKSGSRPFGGFKRGDRLILAIGHETTAQPPAQSDFHLLWAGAVDVR